MQKYDLIIVGAGAAGMLAAIQANAEAPQLRIALLERLPRPGKKLLATGNGRCNVFNTRPEAGNYRNSPFVEKAFRALEERRPPLGRTALAGFGYASSMDGISGRFRA